MYDNKEAEKEEEKEEEDDDDNDDDEEEEIILIIIINRITYNYRLVIVSDTDVMFLRLVLCVSGPTMGFYE